MDWFQRKRTAADINAEVRKRDKEAKSRREALAISKLKKALKQEFINMVGGYKTIHIGHPQEVASKQFLFKKDIDNYFDNILHEYLKNYFPK